MSDVMRGLAASFLLMLSSVTLAATSTDSQLMQIRQLLGFDESLHRQLREQLYRSPDFAAYDDAKRRCISQVVSRNFAGGVDEALRELLDEDAAVKELLSFSRTDSGSLLFAALREDVQDRLLSDGGTERNVDGLVHSLSVEQLAEIGEFSTTPAAELLERVWHMDFSADRSASTLHQLQSLCGVTTPET